jgi:hypothetical protein
VLSLFSHVVLSVILTEERSLQFQLRQDTPTVVNPVAPEMLIGTQPQLLIFNADFGWPIERGNRWCV